MVSRVAQEHRDMHLPCSRVPAHFVVLLSHPGRGAQRRMTPGGYDGASCIATEALHLTPWFLYSPPYAKPRTDGRQQRAAEGIS